ncbi:MAG: CBS domain-containing protein [Anaerolineae bacterium]|nr:CBS domain-containing protein [Anaerolineae bacterium]
MTADVITITPDTAVPDAHNLMRKHGIRRLPVAQDGQLVGIVSMTDIMEAKPSDATHLDVWELNYLLSRLPVSEIMTTDLYTVRTDSTLLEAAQLMYEHKVGGIPVVDTGRRLAGIVTESDIFRVLIDWLKQPEANG